MLSVTKVYFTLQKSFPASPAHIMESLIAPCPYEFLHSIITGIIKVINPIYKHIPLSDTRGIVTANNLSESVPDSKAPQPDVTPLPLKLWPWLGKVTASTADPKVKDFDSFSKQMSFSNVSGLKLLFTVTLETDAN